MSSIFARLKDDKLVEGKKPLVHLFGKDKHIQCDTEPRGYATPENRSPLEHFINVTEGVVPLWEPGHTLRWRFQERSLSVFAHPEEIKKAVRHLLGAALEKWGNAAPIGFTEQNDAWDFEIAVRIEKNCDPTGCVLASAFFPDSGRHEMVVYPSLFEQTPKEQVDTFIHETGHIFGLRHWFADISERAWPFVKVGTHDEFTIMNYGANGELTEADRTDLRLLYQSAWGGTLMEVNGTPIRLVKPYHVLRYQGESMNASRLLQPAVPTRVAAYARTMSASTGQLQADGGDGA